MNILICYMHESELQMQSYEAMNRSTWIWNFGDLVKIYLRKSQTGTKWYGTEGSGSGRGVWMDARVDLIPLRGSRRRRSSETGETVAGSRSSGERAARPG